MRASSIMPTIPALHLQTPWRPHCATDPTPQHLALSYTKYLTSIYALIYFEWRAFSHSRLSCVPNHLLATPTCHAQKLPTGAAAPISEESLVVEQRHCELSTRRRRRGTATFQKGLKVGCDEERGELVEGVPLFSTEMYSASGLMLCCLPTNYAIDLQRRSHGPIVCCPFLCRRWLSDRYMKTGTSSGI